VSRVFRRRRVRCSRFYPNLRDSVSTATGPVPDFSPPFAVRFFVYRFRRFSAQTCPVILTAHTGWDPFYMW